MSTRMPPPTYMPDEYPEAVMCELCREPITLSDPPAVQMGVLDSNGPRMGSAHRECNLREVIGGIGHLLDHQHFCNEMHDPDGGVSYRLSALLVDTWVRHQGVEATVERSQAS